MHGKILAALLTGALLGAPAWAAINPDQLGAAYDATKAKVSFKVYSSKATRIELYLYSTASGSAEKAMRLSDRLFEEGVFAQGIGYPTVPDARSRVRTIVTAVHTREQLDTALAAFEKVGRELGLI